MFLAILSVLLGFLTYGGFYMIYSIYKEKKEIAKKGNVSIFKTFNKDELFGTTFIVVVTIGFLIGFYFSFTNSALFEDSTPSKWDSLTKEEKQWYKDNYGGGKGKEIQDAIDKYKNK